MAGKNRLMCTICGEQKDGGQNWFLVLDDPWLDLLKVLHWNETLAAHPRVHSLCCAAHVRELVAHWMATGSLQYPFASVSSSPAPKVTIHECNRLSEPGTMFDLPTQGLIGELAVHRESLQRALSEYPQCLSAILEALLGALGQMPAESEISAAKKQEMALA